MRKTLRVGAVGGCLNTGWQTVGLDCIYHRILRRKLKQEHDIAAWFYLNVPAPCGVGNLLDDSRKLIADKQPDVLIFQVRPFTAWALHTLVWKRDIEKTGWLNFGLNPYLLKREADADHNRSLATFQFARTNWQLGKWLGMHRLAGPLLLRLFRELQSDCCERGVHLLVLDTAYRLQWPPHCQASITRTLASVITQLNIEYLPLENLQQPGYRSGDDFHLNEKGHVYVAEHLYPRLVAHALEQ